MTELRCADVEARLVDAADGRLEPADSVRFHSHIEGCAACRERAAVWSALIPGLRAAVPPAPDAMTTRRMQIEIERQVGRRSTPAPARRWRAWWIPAAGLAAAAAALVLWMRAGHAPPATPIGYAAIQTLRGAVTVGDRAPAVAARVAVGQPIVLAADAVAQLALDSGAVVRAQGPARLSFEGNARDVTIRLASGKLAAEVTHRGQDETFAVVTADVRVAVRGTKFSVAAAPSGSHVEVSEGRVAVERAGGRTTLVSAGESFDSGAESGTDDSEAAPPTVVTARAPAASCADTTRSCQTAARAVRASMRGGDAERALRIVTEARRATIDADSSCGGGARACEDELRYLRAEALNQAGRLDEAVTAYHALDSKGAPSAMRQNALYAAAQIEKRTGRLTAASADFERALAVAPRGALYEEALIGAMEAAAAAGDDARARAFATRYLGDFPRGLAAPAATRLAGDGARP
jgi:anti-sigma factor RsiW